MQNLWGSNMLQYTAWKWRNYVPTEVDFDYFGDIEEDVDDPDFDDCYFQGF